MVRFTRWSVAHAGALLFASVGVVLSLSGVASLQALCFKDGIVGTNTRRLLESSELNYDAVMYGLYAPCSKTYRFQWFGVVFEAIFLIALEVSRRYGRSILGLQVIGATITTISVLLANDALKLLDDASGKFGSRAAVTLVGFMFIAGGNFGLALLGASEADGLYGTAASTPTALGRPSAAPVGGLAVAETAEVAGASKDATDDGAVVAIIAGLPSEGDEIVEDGEERV